MKVSCKSFADNGVIPIKHTGFGEDISPEFTIKDIPEETVSLAVILDDLDVPFRRNFNHWIIWNIPRTEIIPESLPKGGFIDEPIKACQGIAWGKNCYRGPKPPFVIRKEHRYVFSFFALDCELGISVDSNKKALFEAMKGHILAETNITGRFKKDF